jgi:hypothetical protein
LIARIYVGALCGRVYDALGRREMHRGNVRRYRWEDDIKMDLKETGWEGGFVWTW